jgi:hypothetical protein
MVRFGSAANTWQAGFVFTKLYEVLMASLCARRYAGFKRRTERVATHRMSASCASRLIPFHSFPLGQATQETFVITVSPSEGKTGV